MKAWFKHISMTPRWGKVEAIPDLPLDDNDSRHCRDYLAYMLVLRVLGMEIPQKIDVMTNRWAFFELLSVAANNQARPPSIADLAEDQIPARIRKSGGKRDSNCRPKYSL